MTCAEKLSLMHSGPRHSLSHSLSTAYLSGKISMQADHSAAISCQSQYTVSENRKDSTSACDAGHTWLSAASIEEMYAVAKSPATGGQGLGLFPSTLQARTVPLQWSGHER